MENRIEMAVNQAKKYLKHPRDVAHNLAHHDAVWNNCKAIIENEKIKVDSNLVRIAAYWHDVILGKESSVSSNNVDENVTYLRKYLPSIGFSDKETKIILEAVAHHEFRDSPVNVEGMILQDADKLDVLSKDRWDRTMDAFESGEMSKEKYISYAKTGLKWVTILESTFHFKYSRKIAHESIINIFDNERQIEMFKKVGLQKELDESKRSMDSLETKIKRLLIRIDNIKVNFLVSLRTLFR